MDKSDQLLVRELKQGDEDAFRELVERHQDRIFNTCVSLVKDPDEADDLTQEVFIQIFHSIDKFREDSSLTTWMYRIAVNKSLEYLRKMKRKRRFAFFMRSGKASGSSEMGNTDFNHPGIQAENKEKAAILYRAIEKLPENQRIAFTLHKLEDLSYEQISDIMQKSLSSVESLMHRAKLNLKKELYHYYKS